MTDMPRETERRRRIAVITKMSVENAGNEALSAVLLDWIRGQAPAAEVRVVDRYPRWMTQFSAAMLRRDPDGATRRFDRLVDRILARLRPDPDGPLCEQAGARPVSYHRSPPSPPKLLRPLLRLQVRTRLAEAGLFGRREARRTLNTLAWADLVVWNPAGEIYPTSAWDDALRLLLLVAAARRFGADVAVVNHSVETDDPVLERILTRVYAQASYIAVRGAESLRNASELGASREVLVQVPDLAFLLGEREARPGAGSGRIPAGAIVLAINAQCAWRGRDGWDRLLAGLRDLGRPLVFASNCQLVDRPFAERIGASHGVEIMPGQPSFEALLADYAQAGAIVSSRLHAAIIALCADTPAITLESSEWKISEVIASLEHPFATHDPRRPGWADSALRDVRAALADRERAASAARKAVAAQIARIAESSAPLALLLRRPAQREGG